MNPSASACPKCGTALPPTAAEGLCPRCLFAHLKTSIPSKEAEERVAGSMAVVEDGEREFGDYELLEEQLTETPSIFVFWSAALAEQRRHTASLERMIQRRKAKVCETIIEDSKKEKYKVTQYMLEELVELDDEYMKLQAELVLAKRTESKLWSIVRSIEMKSDNLRTLAGFKKQEMRDIR